MSTRPNVRFFKEQVRFRLTGASRIPAWIGKVFAKHRKVPGDINFIFCSDSYLRKMNKKFLAHDTYTDILTFPTAGGKGPIGGDIFISVDRVRSNAAEFGATFTDELHRVIIHGILHLVGFTDKTTKEKLQMRKQEDACLQLRNWK